ncbi:LuxR family transcriptional regulator [Paracidovorax avenae]|nr:LuxR family transcriptional regulator [Paracidovorax avenae]AVT09688.1 LuxR family transcriptional regulator [Paracidovorax avenae]
MHAEMKIIEKPLVHDDSAVSLCIDQTFSAAREIGFDAAIYDFSPVSMTPEGVLMTPSVLEYRNMPGPMRKLWVEQGMYQVDPVQALALRGSGAFFWSYHQDEESVLQSMLDGGARSVSSVLSEWRMTRGVTVPLHMPGNRFATLTAMWQDDNFAQKKMSLVDSVMRLAYMAHILNDHLLKVFTKIQLTPRDVALSDREHECVLLAAEGMPSKQIAARLNRAESTIVFHLQSAARKLGGRNRAQMIARAAHFGYLSRSPGVRALQ